MTNEAWINRQSETPEARREYEVERLAVWALETISEAMSEHNVSKADLARTLETSRANITQILRGDRNVTLRTLAELAWACDSRIVLAAEPLRQGEFISSPVRRVVPVRMEPAPADEAEQAVEAAFNNIALAA